MQKDVWKLGEKDGALLINWTLTLWCNYNCSYCRQAHQRENHAFDAYPVKQWIQVFENLAPRRLALVITGGEPFLDRKPFRTLLDALSKMEHVDNVRIDTNWGTLDTTRLKEMCRLVISQNSNIREKIKKTFLELKKQEEINALLAKQLLFTKPNV